MTSNGGGGEVWHDALDLEAVVTARAMRYLKPDPIPDAVLWDILDVAIRGPSGGNRQGWGWVVVTDPATKAPIAEWYREGWQRAYGVDRERHLTTPASEGGLGRANYLSAEHLAMHLEEAPVWVFPILEGTAESRSPLTGSSIYGAVQNLMVAARAHGIASVLTSLYGGHEAEVQALLGLPAGARTFALVPLGYPARGRFSPPRRPAVEGVVHWERWGERRERRGAGRFDDPGATS
jgi:nitroreductase